MTVVTPLQARVISGAGDAPELASTLIASIFNVGIAFGAWLGAASLDRGMALQQLPIYGILTCVPATLIALAALLWERRRLIPVAAA